MRCSSKQAKPASSRDEPKVTTLSPFATNSSLRNRKLAAQCPDYVEEKTSFDPSAAEKLLPVAQESSESLRQSALFDGAGAGRAGTVPSGLGGNLRAMLNNSNLFASPSGAGSGFSTKSQTAASSNLYGFGSGFSSSTSMKQSSSTDSPSHHVYHLSPLNTGAVKGPKPVTNKVKDALQVLEMRQLPELWVERLREILGKDLTRIMKL